MKLFKITNYIFKGFICVALFWYLPESPKWLLAAGNITKAESVVKQAAMVNGITLDSNVL
jgi:OCT family organic cation transporter-like MFS transporter 4/5